MTYTASMKTAHIVMAALREICTQTQCLREPEPMIMDNPENVAAFREAGDENGPMAGTYLFNVARATLAVQGSRRVVDLGCGPARFLSRMAKLNPEISFLGLDLSDEMLESARQHLTEQNIRNVELKKADITDLSFLPNQSIDGVISTVTLHHLPTLEHLRTCFREANRILKTSGGIYITDLGRLKSHRSIEAFAYRDVENLSHAFIVDSERSCKAAFLPTDFLSLAQSEMSGRQLEFHSTWLMPLMMTLKSDDRTLPPEKLERLRALKNELTPKNRQELNQLRLFFRLGGMKNDIF